ncbi:MAG TPA: hypothetical protein VN633_24000 [Bryobacteraceae bacterium]|nr:hypothetical protein [Bryobacteraceae bacterium]
MANHYHKGASIETCGEVSGFEAASLLKEIGEFLQRCARPAVLEMGDEPVALLPGEHAWEIRNGSLFFSTWTGPRSINRQIIAIQTKKPGLLVCSIRRFGGAEGRLNVLDLAHPRSVGRLASGGRQNFSEAFRRMLNRQLPDWTIRSLTTEMSLQQSFSPKFPRAILEQGSRRIAAMACPSPADEPQFLSFALLWHSYVSGAEHTRSRVPLVLFLPSGSGNITALRLKWLRVSVRLFCYNEHGSAGEIDVSDLGNMDTQIVRRVPAQSASCDVEQFLDSLAERYGVECVDDAESRRCLRINGLEFAHISRNSVYCGLEASARHQAASFGEVESLAASLATVRAAGADRDHPLYRSQPENWLESSVRKAPGAIDPTLEGQPVWSQVITFAAADRDVIDLLSASRSGRVTVIELKIGEDIQLPLQALDYWMRIEWHIRQGDLDLFFPRTGLLRTPPRLILAAPAVTFHPSNEIVLSYFAPEIETERVGLNLEWQQGLKVAFRLRGSEKPQSQGRCQ